MKGSSTADCTHLSSVSNAQPSPLDRLRQLIEHASHLLPAQGPITVFIHHNTLHAFENLPFYEAVRRGGEIFGCEPYLSEARYHDALGRGRIRFSDLETVFANDLEARSLEVLTSLGTRFDLRLAMLQTPVPSGSAEELSWFVAETDSLRRIRPEGSAVGRVNLIAETRRWVMRDVRIYDAKDRNIPAWIPSLFARFHDKEIETWSDGTWEAFTLEVLWQICCDGVRHIPPAKSKQEELIRHRDLLLKATGIDTDPWVHELMIRFCAAFLDQGVSNWPLPEQEKGFFSSFCSLYRRGYGPPDRWLAGLPVELARIQDAGMSPLETIAESLAILDVDEKEWEVYLSATLLALRGWAGMVQQVEIHSDRVAHPIPADSLIGKLAVRLILERLALAHATKEEFGSVVSLVRLRDFLRKQVPTPDAPGVEERAFPIFQLAQLLGWHPDKLSRLTFAEWQTLVREVEEFDGIERCRIFHLAYEMRFRNQTLDAFALHAAQPITGIPRFQVVTCLDEREESFRRHLEETAPDCATFGVAGFFAVPMYYKGATDAHFVPLCPIVITPTHWVEERADDSLAEAHRKLGSRQRTSDF